MVLFYMSSYKKGNDLGYHDYPSFPSTIGLPTFRARSMKSKISPHHCLSNVFSTWFYWMCSVKGMPHCVDNVYPMRKKVNFMKLLLIFPLLSLLFFPLSAYAEQAVKLDKTDYLTGDVIKVSGKVDFKENASLVIQIRSVSDIVAIEQSSPSKSGSFSFKFDAVGPKWTQSGIYTIIVSYNGEKMTKTFNFSVADKKTPGNESSHIQQNLPSPKPKVTIAGFPDPSLSPNYYINLYNTDIEFKTLFDSSFPDYQIKDLVGYGQTHVHGFPDNDFSPQYYIDRYNNEPRFKVWFDSQFPNDTIYGIVGVTNEIKSAIPSWIKKYAQMWSDDKITDVQFTSGITELIQKNILVVSDDIVKTKSSGTMPIWFKNTARWYSDDTITEDDFLLGLQYLIEKGIIII